VARCGGTVPTLQAFPSGLQGGDVLCGCLCLSPFPLQLLIFFVAATVLYITAFIACAAAVDLTSLRGSRPYNQRSAASVSMSQAPAFCRVSSPGLCELTGSCLSCHWLDAQWASFLSEQQNSRGPECMGSTVDTVTLSPQAGCHH
jgi:hypothetical protein